MLLIFPLSTSSRTFFASLNASTALIRSRDKGSPDINSNASMIPLISLSSMDKTSLIAFLFGFVPIHSERPAPLCLQEFNKPHPGKLQKGKRSEEHTSELQSRY